MTPHFLLFLPDVDLSDLFLPGILVLESFLRELVFSETLFSEVLVWVLVESSLLMIVLPEAVLVEFPFAASLSASSRTFFSLNLLLTRPSFGKSYGKISQLLYVPFTSS